MTLKLSFDNAFAGLPETFYTRLPAEGFARHPVLLDGNQAVADMLSLGADVFTQPDFADYFSGNRTLEGADSIATVYAGHQFGHYVPQLGDGRALLLGQLRDPTGALWDLQLKGGGLTPYSRFADGRAVMRSSIREYLASEAMHALHIPTTRALCIVATGEQVEREMPEPGAIITRVAQTHIRFGHFEYFYHAGRHAEVIRLADHVIEHYFPHLANLPDRYARWYEEITARTARLVAMWQAAGFAHGVMNTDNMSILGLTIDYGPFGFMEAMDPGFICNHSDHQGRYAFDQQPRIAQWNLWALANALQPVLPLEQADALLAGFAPAFHDQYNTLILGKIGIHRAGADDARLWQSLLKLMGTHRADYTNTFRLLATLADPNADTAQWMSLFADAPDAATWLGGWRARVARESTGVRFMPRVNPKYVLRNWVAETVIRAVEDHDDKNALRDMRYILQNPYNEHENFAHFAHSAPEALRNLCVSCSS